ncbi:MAG TPA: class I SAM-dependent rRNA methyltransferase, partial [Alphaproteobacteria bacterium]|nr:class I SAM-dependent rRNA methyltransferase [Alphaproteobacteria bacterium]
MNASPTDYMPPTIQPLIADPWSDYALLDTGNGRKLERYGKIVVNRPEPQALWSPILPESEWNKANAIFTNTGGEDGDSGKWEIRGKTPESWDVSWKDITMVCRLMSFRHMGLFPEQ